MLHPKQQDVLGSEPNLLHDKVHACMASLMPVFMLQHSLFKAASLSNLTSMLPQAKKSLWIHFICYTITYTHFSTALNLTSCTPTVLPWERT
jgi:hypothetical protein